jgi:hypothetical protein
LGISQTGLFDGLQEKYARLCLIVFFQVSVRRIFNVYQQPVSSVVIPAKAGTHFAANTGG